MRYCIEKFHQFCVAIVCHPALPSEMMMIIGYKFVEGHPALWTVLEQLHYISGELRKMLTQKRTVAQFSKFCKNKCNWNNFRSSVFNQTCELRREMRLLSPYVRDKSKEILLHLWTAGKNVRCLPIDVGGLFSAHWTFLIPVLQTATFTPGTQLMRCSRGTPPELTVSSLAISAE